MSTKAGQRRALHPDESGAIGSTRHISGGRADVRLDPTFRAPYAQLNARGKAHTVAIIACLRRLLGIAAPMLRAGLDWHETEAGQVKFAPPQL